MEEAPRQQRRKYLKPTIPQPEWSELEEADFDGFGIATDGCDRIEPDGTCEHGHVSWLRYLGVI